MMSMILGSFSDKADKILLKMARVTRSARLSGARITLMPEFPGLRSLSVLWHLWTLCPILILGKLTLWLLEPAFIRQQ